MEGSTSTNHACDSKSSTFMESFRLDPTNQTYQTKMLSILISLSFEALFPTGDGRKSG